MGVGAMTLTLATSFGGVLLLVAVLEYCLERWAC